jgi:general secretion pathway protein F
MKYTIVYQHNGSIKTLKVDNLEELPKNVIKIKENRSFLSYKLKHNHKKEIFDMFKQLSIMLNANLTLSAALDLLLKSKQSKPIEMILFIIQSSITSGKPIDRALLQYTKSIGELPIQFLKLGIENGNIKQSLNSLVELLDEDIKTKAKFNDSMRYPILLISSLLVSIMMIFIYVVPNFEHIFTMTKDQIPTATKVLISINNIVQNYFYVIFVTVIVASFLLYVLYKRFTFYFHKILILHIPIVKRVLKDYYFYRLFLLISIIVNSKYQFQIAIENSKNLIPNVYIKKLIETIISDIKNGVSISDAFSGTNIFDSLTIKLLYTAEQTTQYETILEDIAIYYKFRFQESLKLFSSYIEPLIILCIALVVLWLMLAIMTPIWNMSNFLS